MKINPCPYCGCDEPYIYNDGIGYAVMCPRYYCGRIVVTFFETEEKAVEYWNNELKGEYYDG